MKVYELGAGGREFDTEAFASVDGKVWVYAPIPIQKGTDVSVDGRRAVVRNVLVGDQNYEWLIEYSGGKAEARDLHSAR